MYAAAENLAAAMLQVQLIFLSMSFRIDLDELKELDKPLVLMLCFGNAQWTGRTLP